VYGREKTLYGIYRKMLDKHLSFSQVLDVTASALLSKISVRVITLGTLHALFKPMPGKFKDYIAIPKTNGYQSLHTTIGPYGTPVEFQIRTREMHRVAESGVAAHWLYKNEGSNLTDLQQRTHAWLQSLSIFKSKPATLPSFLNMSKSIYFPARFMYLRRNLRSWHCRVAPLRWISHTTSIRISVIRQLQRALTTSRFRYVPN
jgi:GTP pyrophosphokinase